MLRILIFIVLLFTDDGKVCCSSQAPHYTILTLLVVTGTTLSLALGVLPAAPQGIQFDLDLNIVLVFFIISHLYNIYIIIVFLCQSKGCNSGNANFSIVDKLALFKQILATRTSRPCH